MTEFWLDQRRIRVTDPSRTPFVIDHKSDIDGHRMTYVAGEFLLHPDDAGGNDLGSSDYEQVIDDVTWLADYGLQLHRYLGSEDLPVHLARMRSRSRDFGIAEPRIALHYVLSGEPKAGVPHGGPAATPSEPSLPPSSSPWAGPSQPAVAVLDTGLALGSTPASIPAGEVVTAASYDPDVDIDTLLITLPGPHHGELDCEAGHGTFITSLINRFTDGCVRIASIKVLEPDGLGSEKSVVSALRRLRANFPEPTVEVVNLSLGGFTDDGGWSDEPDVVDEYARDLTDRMPLALAAELAIWAEQYPSTVFVACAGNDSTAVRPFWPAAAAADSWKQDPPVAPVVIAVGSVKPNHEPSSFTNTGDWITVSTLGDDILSEFPDGDVAVAEGQTTSFTMGAAHWSGTSFATPLVAAEILRLASSATNDGSIPVGGALDAARTFLRGLAVSMPGLGLIYDPRDDGPRRDPTVQ